MLNSLASMLNSLVVVPLFICVTTLQSSRDVEQFGPDVEHARLDVEQTLPHDSGTHH